MSARILVVDDLAPNRNLLDVKLSADYYDVLTAESGEEALEIASKERLDLILMDAIMPGGMDGFEACRRLKADPALYHIPVIMVTALEETADRIRGLEAGADDFITKPIDDFNLTARVRSLLRLKMTTDQLMSHTGHSAENCRPMLDQIQGRPGRLLLIGDEGGQPAKIDRTLGQTHETTIVTDPVEAIRRAKAGIDLVIVSLVARSFDGLRVCASLRFNNDTADIPILAIGDPDDQPCFIRAFDIGVNDSVMRPVESQELSARVNTLLRRKFYADSLRENFNEDLEMVVSDPLTGLGNRRFFERQVEPLFDTLNLDGTPFSILVFDIDHFKRVNDILGHDMGDQILKEVAARIVTNMRAIDIVSRYGGEEFMIAMPGTSEAEAFQAADRVRSFIAGTPIFVEGQALSITISAGVAQVEQNEQLRGVFRRADSALYQAKREGRNQVAAAASQTVAAA
ncbi:PleD family two-component system response regulator [Algimonas porphyrae]|uniref:diguanylate cyclase n=1 Tax=Algimonas porphyrae TaxID=1128113 RepID=A0ABQ5UW94_9PROT|nr:PleD family two-component system response regulator [Algimonas porphyrae]GLQ19545.1 response regulator PleD [Algimonas porphyrae]